VQPYTLLFYYALFQNLVLADDGLFLCTAVQCTDNADHRRLEVAAMVNRAKNE